MKPKPPSILTDLRSIYYHSIYGTYHNVPRLRVLTLCRLGYVVNDGSWDSWKLTTAGLRKNCDPSQFKQASAARVMANSFYQTAGNILERFYDAKRQWYSALNRMSPPSWAVTWPKDMGKVTRKVK